jgi:muramoyltetrapeptide carboxypeptidase LdcA involved in peptidoglycan recycling
MVRRPPYIKSGDTLGITAPSFGAFIEPYCYLIDMAENNLRNRGYKIVEGETARKGDGIGISTDPKVAGKELMDFYLRDDINAIISAGGGELMCNTISNVDFMKLKAADPKWFIGYSDNTNFVFPLVTIADTQAIYGPCINGFGKDWEDTELDSLALMEGTKSSFDGYKRFGDPTLFEEKEPDPDHVYTEEELREGYILNADRELVNYVSTGDDLKPAGDEKIEMKGVLLGGCLDILVNLCGTRFDRVKEFKEENPDIIWVLEACDLNPMTIWRSMWNLKEAGWFDGAKGFIIGRPEASWKLDMMGADQYNAVTEVVKDLGVPVVMDAEIGHVGPMMPVVMGAEAKVTVKGNDLNITYC